MNKDTVVLLSLACFMLGAIVTTLISLGTDYSPPDYVNIAPGVPSTENWRTLEVPEYDLCLKTRPDVVVVRVSKDALGHKIKFYLFREEKMLEERLGSGGVFISQNAIFSMDEIIRECGQ